MMTVYHATNSIEAYLVKNLLQQQEIAAFVLGEHLQGGVGEIPATGLVRVSVSDSDYAKAKEVVDAWDSGTVIENIDANYSYLPA